VDEIEKLKDEFNEFNQRKEQALQNNEEFNEEFLKNIPNYPDEEIDLDLLNEEHVDN